MDNWQKWCYAIKNMWQMRGNDFPKNLTSSTSCMKIVNYQNWTQWKNRSMTKSVLEYEDVKETMKFYQRDGEG